jgi:superfamily I DNA and/or RNA helicase
MYYDIELNSTIASFILNIKNKVRENFNIDNNYAIDIVEAGQFNNINGRDAELAPALEPSNLTLLQKYENNYKQTSFYIRNR